MEDSVMGNYNQAVQSAPHDADYIAYEERPDSWVVLKRHADGEIHVVANCNHETASLIASGVSEWRKSLWNAEAGKFTCGTVEQLERAWLEGRA
jgi:hypothetical protein